MRASLTVYAALGFMIISAFVLTLILLANGNILVFDTEPKQVCVGWPDDAVYSWWCTPDYTARAPEDVNRDGTVDVLDVQLVVNAALAP